jgi:hypothetical protein
METNPASGPADSPVPGVVPAAPRIEADRDRDDREAVPHEAGEAPSSASGSTARKRGPVGALLARLLRKEG